MPPSLTHRHLEPELMDDPALAPSAHTAALRGLARINRWSHSAEILWPAIQNLCLQNPGKKTRLLDIATGAGDVPINLLHKARHAGFTVDIEACDRSPTAIEIAGRHAHDAGVAIRFFTLDVINQPIPTGYDVIISSLFLHHLATVDAGTFLKKLANSDARFVLIHDLVRSRRGLLLAATAGRLLSRSPIVHVDAPRSVRAAFTPQEVQKMAANAGMATATVTRRWPFRFLLHWIRP